MIVVIILLIIICGFIFPEIFVVLLTIILIMVYATVAAIGILCETILTLFGKNKKKDEKVD